MNEQIHYASRILTGLINFRYTVLESDGGTVVHVPNSIMFSNSVTVEGETGEIP